MRKTMLNAKLHRVRVTHSELDYEGSVAIDSALLEAAQIHEYEQVEVYNVTNGERFGTYAIRAEKNSGIISVNGAAAHRADPGDIIIICTYVSLEESELKNFKPRLVYVDDSNRISHMRNTIPVQVA
ncbi:MAG: aspartate 1-decarboxylase [Acidiferrobacterales bacterium]|jgi:aspartate 1-decarboxylase